LEYWRIESDRGEGIFYVDWSTFLYFFNQVTISQLDDNANYLYDTIKLDNDTPKYLSIALEAEANFHLIIAQTNVRRTVVTPKYANIRVLVASLSHDYDNRPIYEYSLSKFYSRSYINNYMSVDLSALPPGNYVARIILSNDVSPTELTLGYYGSGDFSVKFLDGVDDDEFVSKTLLSRARSIDPTKNPCKVELNGGAKGWRCIENIIESNICYVAYRIESSSLAEKYAISFDERYLSLYEAKIKTNSTLRVHG
jgi:hypothetical protein